MSKFHVYAKRLNSQQRKLLRDFEGLTGWEPICQDDLDSGKMTFAEVWYANVNLLHDTLADVENMTNNRRGTGL